MISRRKLSWLLLAGLLGPPVALAHADDDDSDDHSGDDHDGDDHERALDAVRNYHAASFKEIIAIVRRAFEGDIVDVSIVGSGPNLVYRIKLLDEENQLIEVLVNAVSRKIVSAKGI